MSDMPACNIVDRPKALFSIDSLELNQCCSLEVNTALNEFEVKHPGLSHRFETWPPDVRRRITCAIDEWTKAHQTAVLRMTSFALYRGVCVVALHYIYPPK